MIWRVILFWLLGANLAWAGLPRHSSVAFVAFCSNSLSQSQYDSLNRLTNVNFPDGSSFTNQYDLLGRLTNQIDGAGNSEEERRGQLMVL